MKTEEIIIWVKTIGPLLFSWPVVVFFLLIIFRKSIDRLVAQLALSRQDRRISDNQTVKGGQEIAYTSHLNQLVISSCLLGLEIIENNLGSSLTQEQRQRLRAQIEELRNQYPMDK